MTNSVSRATNGVLPADDSLRVITPWMLFLVATGFGLSSTFQAYGWTASSSTRCRRGRCCACSR